jgi:hypothetical protein
MIKVLPEWTEQPGNLILVERLVQGIYDFYKGKTYHYLIIQMGDLLAQVGFADPQNERLPIGELRENENRLWIPAIYYAVKSGRLAFLSGDPQQFSGIYLDSDESKAPEDRCLMESALLDPSGKVYFYLVLRSW